VWVTDDVLVSDVYVAAGDGLTAVWVTVAVLVSNVCVADGHGVTAGWVTVNVLASDGYVVADPKRVIVVCVTVEEI
jgi:hypothetical protein